nr:hypothetical protein [Tanacetum cinerariifolium]
MAKLILNEAQTVQYLAEPSIKCNEKYELGEELLKELCCNSYSGKVKKDVIGHIAKILKVLDSIKMDDLGPFQLRMIAFPLSLSGNARKWWMNEGDGKINTWEELELDKNAKNELWEFYVNGRTKGTISDLINESCNESNKKTCLDSFSKPYLDVQDVKDIYEIIDRDYSPIPILAHRDITNPDELCQTKEFAVVRNRMEYPRV